MQGWHMTKILLYKQQLLETLGPLQDTSVLDYGCGKGDLIKLLLEMNPQPKLIYVADSSLDMLEQVKVDFAEVIVQGIVIPKLCQTPSDLSGLKFDKIICHNVLECVPNKITFINAFADILAKNGTLIISHIDFDSVIYNSSYKELTRALVYNFADTQQAWQEHSDGQIGRKIPGLVAASAFKDRTKCETWRRVEQEFKPGNYGFLMAEMIAQIAKNSYDPKELELWLNDLTQKDKNQEYYFAVDLNVALIQGD